jgi:hypothetical protein
MIEVMLPCYLLPALTMTFTWILQAKNQTIYPLCKAYSNSPIYLGSQNMPTFKLFKEQNIVKFTVEYSMQL